MKAPREDRGQEACHRWFRRQIETFKEHDTTAHTYTEYANTSTQHRDRWKYSASARCIRCQCMFLMPSREDPVQGEYAPGSLSEAWKEHTLNSPFCVIGLVHEL